MGAIKSSAWAGGGAVFGAGMAAAYCWVHGDGDADGDGVPDSRDKCPDTPQGVKVDAAGCPIVAVVVVEEVVVVKQEAIVVRDVNFEFNSARLTAADKEKLNIIAARLKKDAANAQLKVTGYTDSVGNEAYNLKLSKARAQSVVEYLIDSGVPRSQFVSVEGAGESNPVASNQTPEGRAQNRRTEILIIR
ncbi:OmpA family protein [Pseudomonas fragi]|uniref:OmpA family protein n=1 Tax=Pseudomonas fragi TaxID=296 RepID=UPI000BA29CCF|nr:hypothetical protein CJU72_19040 [Pseudomonas fragi]